MGLFRKPAVRFRQGLSGWLFRTFPPEWMLALRQLRQRVQRRPANRPFPIRAIQAVERIPAAPSLVLAPHPDDEVIGMGGTLAQLLEQRAPVTVLYLTDGRGPGAADLSIAAARRMEAEALGRRFGFGQVFWDVPDNTLTDAAVNADRLCGLLESLQPQQIFLPSFFDHQYDHFAANLLLLAALRKIRLPEAWIYGYEVWDNIPFPNYLVDVTGHFEAKADMMGFYAVPSAVTDFTGLFRHRGALHFMLYVTSVQRSPEGLAEAFHRSTAADFCAGLDEFLGILKTANSPLLAAAANE